MSERLSIWLLRVLALAIACGLWFSLSYDKRERQSERVVRASVTYDTPGGVMVLNPVDQVAVRVRGASKLVRTLNPNLVNVLVVLPRDYTGPYEASFEADDAFLPEGLEAVAIEPASIRLTLDKVISREVPVRVELTGEPAAGAVLTGPPIAIPNSARVVGPESRLAGVRQLSTRVVSLDGHAQTWEETAPLLTPDPLSRVEPGVVRVRVLLEPPRLSTEALERPRARGETP